MTCDGGFEVLGMAGGFGRSDVRRFARLQPTEMTSTLTASTATRVVAAQAQLRADVFLHLPTDASVTERFLRFATGTRGASPCSGFQWLWPRRAVLRTGNPAPHGT